MSIKHLQNDTLFFFLLYVNLHAGVRSTVLEYMRSAVFKMGTKTKKQSVGVNFYDPLFCPH